MLSCATRPAEFVLVQRAAISSTVQTPYVRVRDKNNEKTRINQRCLEWPFGCLLGRVGLCCDGLPAGAHSVGEIVLRFAQRDTLLANHLAERPAVLGTLRPLGPVRVFDGHSDAHAGLLRGVPHVRSIEHLQNCVNVLFA